jgi:hypothetical protein
MGAVVTGAGEPVPIFQRLASPIFQIADFSDRRFFRSPIFQRLASPIWANLDAGKKKTKKTPSKKISARNRPKSQRIFEFTNFYFIF